MRHMIHAGNTPVEGYMSSVFVGGVTITIMFQGGCWYLDTPDYVSFTNGNNPDQLARRQDLLFDDLHRMINEQTRATMEAISSLEEANMLVLADPRLE